MAASPGESKSDRGPWAQGRIIVESGATTGVALTAVLCLVALVVARSAPRVSRRGAAMEA